MYKYIIITVLLFISCKETVKVDIPKQEKTINTFMDAWHKAAADANFDGYFGRMSSNSIFIGTDATENWEIEQFKSFSKPYFDKGKAWSFTAEERNVFFNENGDVAWFDELLNTWMGSCRGSGVLTKKDDKWQLEHYVLSVTAPNEKIKEIIALKKAQDSVLFKK